MAATGDYRDVRSVVVHAADVAAAVEANRTGGSRTVIRVTPPFGGRMRGRLHVERTDEYDADPEPFHIDPTSLVAATHSYPTPDETERRLRADPATDYTVETHHERHAAAVEAWREGVADGTVDSVVLDGPDGPHRVGVATLG